MARVRSFTATRLEETEAQTVVTGSVVGDNLVLGQKDGSTVVAGNVRGPKGDQGVGIPSGGATGQLLMKASYEDHDYVWGEPTQVGGYFNATIVIRPEDINNGVAVPGLPLTAFIVSPNTLADATVWAQYNLFVAESETLGVLNIVGDVTPRDILVNVGWWVVPPTQSTIVINVAGEFSVPGIGYRAVIVSPLTVSDAATWANSGAIFSWSGVDKLLVEMSRPLRQPMYVIVSVI